MLIDNVLYSLLLDFPLMKGDLSLDVGSTQRGVKQGM